MSQAAELTIEPLDATFGAVVTGVSLSQLTAGAWSEIEAAFNDYGLLIFPGQHLNEAEQDAFGARFGRIQISAVPISNAKGGGKVLGPDEHQYWILRGNERWHHDSSFMPLAAKASLLTAKALPSWGGLTEWADMRAAYDVLEPAEKEKFRVRSKVAL